MLLICFFFIYLSGTLNQTDLFRGFTSLTGSGQSNRRMCLCMCVRAREAMCALICSSHAHMLDLLRGRDGEKRE